MLRIVTFVIVSSSLLASSVALAQSRGFSSQVQRQLDQLKQEPSVQEAQKAALKFFNIDPGSVASMRGRAAWKGLMPQVEARFRQNQSTMDADQLNTKLNPEAPTVFDNVNGSVQEFQVGVRFNLPLLVFNAEVLDVGSLAVLQEGVLKEVTRLYYTRRRLQINLILNPPTNAATQLSKELRIDELTSTLDAMTGNLFDRSKKRRMRTERVNRNRGDVLRPLP